jgi:hypothetical protein
LALGAGQKFLTGRQVLFLDKGNGADSFTNFLHLDQRICYTVPEK